jgi:parvulin-like peptidyl-prolyl isomerase
MHSLSLWGLRGRVLREQARDRLLAQQPQLTDEQREIAVQRWLESRQIRMADELECWMAREGIANDDLAILAERQMRWLLYLEQRYRSAVPTLFLKRKNKLDQVVYSLVWVQDEALATEVFLQLKEEETSFDTLWRQLPPGGDAELPNGRIGPVPMGSLSEGLAELLRISRPGQVWPPKQLGSGFIIVRLDERRPAVLNDVRRQELLIELGDALLQEQLQSPSTDHS